MIKIIEDIEELISLNSELEKVYKSNGYWCMISPTLIISFFNFLSKQNKDIVLYIVLNINNDEVESYLPLYIDESETLRFVFDVHIDYCGIIGKKVESKFLKDLSNLIQTDNRIQRVDFDNLLLNDSLLNGLKYYLKFGACISSYNSHSFILSSKEHGYFKSLKSRDRSELLRVAKKNNNTVFSTFYYPDPFPLKEILTLRDKMIFNGYRNKDFLNESFLLIIESLYKSKELILISNLIDDDMVSIVFTFKNNLQKSYIFWIALYDKNIQYINLTSYLNFILQNEFEDNYCYSFARGEYAFKTTFSPVTENLYNFRYSKSKWDFFFTNYYPIKEFVKRIVKTRK